MQMGFYYFYSSIGSAASLLRQCFLSMWVPSNTVRWLDKDGQTLYRFSPDSALRFSPLDRHATLSVSPELSPWVRVCQRLFLPEVSADRISQTSAVLALLKVNKPASELPSQSLLIIVNGTARQQEPTGTCTASALRSWLHNQTVSWH